MVNITLTAHLGQAFGNHKVEVSVNHTGQGHLDFRLETKLKLPFLPKLDKQIEVTSKFIEKILDIKSISDKYIDLLRSNNGFIDLDNLVFFNLDSAAISVPLPIKKIGFDPVELSHNLELISNAARVEKVRSNIA